MNLLRRDRLKSVFFELGARWYARKLATGPEMELRRAFVDWLVPSSGARVLDVGCGPGHLARLLVQRGCCVTATDRSRRLLREMARVTRTGGTVASLDPSDAMQVGAMRAWSAAERLSARDTRKLVLWALAAERIGQRFSEATLLRLFTAASLTEVQWELRLGGMVWFARAIKPPAS